MSSVHTSDRVHGKNSGEVYTGVAITSEHGVSGKQFVLSVYIECMSLMAM